MNDDTPRLLHRESAVPLNAISARHLANRFVAAAFSPHRRSELAKLALTKGFSASSALIDDTAVIASTSSVGHGSYINALSAVASVCRIGEHVFINRSSNVGHHVLVGDFVSIGPGVTITSGEKIGSGSIIGAGSVILPGVTIGDNSVVSAGTKVSTDIPENHIASGDTPTIRPIQNEKKFLYLPDQE